MKYEYYPKRRAEQERRELNEQILRLLQSGACEQSGVTDEDIFNRYTGDGGLHGLRRSDYDSYNAFSAAKKELENGQFFTPPPLCEMIVSALRLSDTDLVADLTCGMGNFFNFLPNERNAYGCEVDPNAYAVARKLYPQAHIVQGDIRDYEPQMHFDFVLGNPPFHLRWIMPDATVMTSHQYYCLKAAKLLKPLGILAVIVPASFLADSFSDKGAIRMMESHFSFLGQVMLPEHAFSDSGVDGFPTKLQFWQKRGHLYSLRASGHGSARALREVCHGRKGRSGRQSEQSLSGTGTAQNHQEHFSLSGEEVPVSDPKSSGHAGKIRCLLFLCPSVLYPAAAGGYAL